MSTPIATTESNIDNTQGLNAETINEVVSSVSSMRHDGNNTYYSLNEYEFKAFKRGAFNGWENLTIFCLGLFIPSTISVVEKWGSLDLSLFLYCLASAVSGILLVVFGYNWFQTKNDLKVIIDCVEKKPRVTIPGQ